MKKLLIILIFLSINAISFAQTYWEITRIEKYIAPANPEEDLILVKTTYPEKSYIKSYEHTMEIHNPSKKVYYLIEIKYDISADDEILKFITEDGYKYKAIISDEVVAMWDNYTAVTNLYYIKESTLNDINVNQKPIKF